MGCCLIDREYYPLDVAAKILKCDEGDLIHWAASGDLKVHVLTGMAEASRYTSEDEGIDIERHQFSSYDKFLPQICLVGQYHWYLVESLSNSILGMVHPKDCIETDDEWWQGPWINFDGSEIELTAFVILHDELEKLKQDSPQTKWNANVSEIERSSMLKLIIGMAIDAYGYDPKGTRNAATGDKNGISEKLKTRGINIDADTVRKYINEAKNNFYPENQ